MNSSVRPGPKWIRGYLSDEPWRSFRSCETRLVGRVACDQLGGRSEICGDKQTDKVEATVGRPDENTDNRLRLIDVASQILVAASIPRSDNYGNTSFTVVTPELGRSC